MGAHRFHPAAGARARTALLGFGAALLIAGCGDGAPSGPALDADSTPTSRSSGPRPTPDSPPAGGAGGVGAGDAIGSGGGITGSGGATPTF